MPATAPVFAWRDLCHRDGLLESRDVLDLREEAASAKDVSGEAQRLISKRSLVPTSKRSLVPTLSIPDGHVLPARIRPSTQ